MFVAGPGQSSNPTTAIGQEFRSSDALDILLNPVVTAIAFEIFQNFGDGSRSGGDQLYLVEIVDVSGLLGSTNVTVLSGSAGFFGVSSTIAGEITRVSVSNVLAFEVIDNVRFGGASVPEPASLALMGLGFAAVARARSRAKPNARRC